MAVLKYKDDQGLWQVMEVKAINGKDATVSSVTKDDQGNTVIHWADGKTTTINKGDQGLKGEPGPKGDKGDPGAALTYDDLTPEQIKSLQEGIASNYNQSHNIPTKVSDLENDLGFVTTDTTYGVASQTSDGLMAKTDKAKLDAIEAGAEKNKVTSVNGNSPDDSGNVTIDLSGYQPKGDYAKKSHTHNTTDITGLDTALAEAGKVKSVAGKTGNVTLMTTDISGMGDYLKSNTAAETYQTKAEMAQYVLKKDGNDGGILENKISAAPYLPDWSLEDGQAGLVLSELMKKDGLEVPASLKTLTTIRDIADDADVMGSLVKSTSAMHAVANGDKAMKALLESTIGVQAVINDVQGTNTALPAMLESYIAVYDIAESRTAMDLFAQNEAALNAFLSTNVKMPMHVSFLDSVSAFVGSRTAMRAILTNAEARQKLLFDSATFLHLMAASSTAMKEVAASSTAMKEVAASSTAMKEVAASSTAMKEVAASSVAMTAITDSEYVVKLSNDTTNNGKYIVLGSQSQKVFDKSTPSGANEIYNDKVSEKYTSSKYGSLYNCLVVGGNTVYTTLDPYFAKDGYWVYCLNLNAI